MSNFLNFAGNSGVTFKNHGTGGGTSFTLDKSASTNSVLLSIGGIIQKPSTDYTVSGVTITTTSSVTSGVEVFSLIIHDAGNAPVIEDNSIVTAKIADNQVTGAKLNPALVQGDLIYADGTDTINRLAKGTAAQVLTMNTGATAPEWSAPAGLTNYGFFAQRTSAQSISANTWTKVTFDTETYDPQSDYDNSSNYRYTPQSAGYYFCALTISLYSAAGAAQTRGAIYKNGSSFLNSSYTFSGGAGYGKTQTTVGPIYLNGSSDYIEGYAWHNGTGASNFAGPGGEHMLFSAWKIGVA